MNDFSLHTSRHAFLCVFAIMIVFAQPTRANCTALPSLAPLVQEVEHLSSLSNRTAIQTSVQKLDRLQTRLQPARIFGQLARLGFERKMPDILAFQTNLAGLKAMQAKNGSAGVLTVLRSQHFQSSYRRIRDLTEDLCLRFETNAGSDRASRSYAALSSLNLASLTRISPLTVTVGLVFLTIASLMGIVLGSRMRAERLTREKRRNKRYPCNIPVQMTSDDTTTLQYLVDISRSGANIKCQLGLHDGAKIKLSFGGIDLEAEVIWGNSKYAGVRFDRLLPQHDIVQALRNLCQTTAAQNAKRGTPLGTAHITQRLLARSIDQAASPINFTASPNV